MTEVNLSDLELILAGAKIIQNGERYHTVIEKLKGEGRENLPMEAVYEIAENEYIDRKNIDNYMKMRFPSKEMQRETRIEIGSVPSEEAIINFHKRILLSDLETKFLNESFEWKKREYRLNFYNLIKKTEEKKKIQKRILFKKYEKEVITTQEEIIAYLYTWGFEDHRGFNIEINQPFVAEACKDKLKELKKRFSRFFEEYSITTSYLNS